ncbi:MAG TPA: thioredoxin family protein [Planctomycetota bacterium]|nr:thioredoxin family protein [Planctomycetota bacterium]OQC20677.1 MAG: Thioredoxin-1 [Planctomycetes bacterium ADurb.Bin069]HNR98288.1 thioredoxin family protein [Planctomycetota bacterium]HNU24606.1 thioredoxin family protein [Planctomycetota bacterium]HOE29000.1 thioredoxin family protein [Planctomycetota bacterium]
MLLKLLIGAGIGALIGGALGGTRSCETGACPLTANPTRGAVVGGLVGLALAMGIPAPSSAGASQTAPRPAAAAVTLETLTADLAAHQGKALVVFSAPWCPACRRYEPNLAAAAAILGPAARIITIDSDESGDVASHYGITHLPTSLLFEKGKEVNRFVGAKSSNELVELLGGTNER